MNTPDLHQQAEALAEAAVDLVTTMIVQEDRPTREILAALRPLAYSALQRVQAETREEAELQAFATVIEDLERGKWFRDVDGRHCTGCYKAEDWIEDNGHDPRECPYEHVVQHLNAKREKVAAAIRSRKDRP